MINPVREWICHFYHAIKASYTFYLMSSPDELPELGVETITVTKGGYIYAFRKNSTWSIARDIGPQTVLKSKRPECSPTFLLLCPMRI